MELTQYVLAGLAAFFWLVILALPWKPWRNGEVLEALPGSEELPEHLADVTVIIPARDEAQVIGQTLHALAAQGPGLRVILVDDSSNDGTAQIAQSIPGLDLQVISGQPLPEGWSGKLWALEQGVRSVETALTLLLDADICLDAGVIAALIGARQRRQVQFLSVMATLHMASFWEKLLNPAFIYFFKMLYPFGLANSANPRFASAAGGCILLETRLFAAIGGLSAIRGALIDDCTLASKVKRAGYRTWIGLSRSVNSVRPYAGLKEIWNMVARSAFTQLRYSLLILLLTSFFLLLLFWAPVLGLFSPHLGVRLLSLVAWSGMSVAYLPTLRFYGLHPAWALLMPLTGGLYLGMTWDSALRYWRGERSRWKGRIYRRPAG